MAGATTAVARIRVAALAAGSAARGGGRGAAPDAAGIRSKVASKRGATTADADREGLAGRDHYVGLGEAAAAAGSTVPGARAVPAAASARSPYLDGERVTSCGNVVCR